jgi:hypothetical protein
VSKQLDPSHGSPEVTRLVALMSVKYPLSLRNVEGLLFECCFDFFHDIVERAMLRFQRMKTLQKFAHGWHLTSQATYKQNRSAALAEWGSLIA